MSKSEQHNFLKSLLLVCAVVAVCLWFFWPTESAVEITPVFVEPGVETLPSSVSDGIEPQQQVDTPLGVTSKVIAVTDEMEQPSELDSELPLDQAQQRLAGSELDDSAEIVDPQELSSLLKVDINHTIEQWRQAWQAGDAELYLNFYSSQFAPPTGATRAAWQAQRKQRVSPQNQITLRLSNFNVQLEDDNQKATVSFDQVYASATYQENSRKQLVLVKAQEWRIVAESELADSP